MQSMHQRVPVFQHRTLVDRAFVGDFAFVYGRRFAQQHHACHPVGAACGLCRYESTAFGADYQNNLFATTFNLHKITRHVLKHAGASFSTEDSDFLTCTDVDFHPTDVLEDKDGSLLVVDTGGWYKLCCPTSQLEKPAVLGAIYRVRRDGTMPIADPRGRDLDWKGMTPEGLAALLADPRPAVVARLARTLGPTTRPAQAYLQHQITAPPHIYPVSFPHREQDIHIVSS